MPTAREIIVRGSTTGQDTSVITQGQPLEVVLQSGQGPAGIPGRNPEFQFSATHLQYRLEGDTVWIDLLPVSEIEGPQGPQGAAGQDGVPVSLRVENGFLQWRYVDESNPWTDLLDMETLKGDKGDTGDTGDVTELRVDSGFIQWKYTQDVSWNNLIEISELKGDTGDAGDNVELRTDSGFIQWKLTQDATWNNLVELSTLQGPQGDTGDNIELRVDGGFIEWKLTDDLVWNQLIALIELEGPQGPVGEGLNILGTLNDPDDLPTSANTGDAYIIDGDMWIYDGTTWNNVGNVVGPEGDSIELRVDSGFIQWKYTQSSTWFNLIELSELQGPQGAPGTDGTDGTDGVDGVDGREVELQTTATHIQWRYEGEAWNDLVTLSSLQGPQGDDGREIEVQNSGTHIQWRYVGDPTWINLVVLDDLKGDKGDPGSVIPMATPPLNPIEGQMWWNSSDLTLYIWYNDGDSSQWVVAASQGPIGPQGESIELRTSGGFIQWRVVGDTSWINLISLEALEGPAGSSVTILGTLLDVGELPASGNTVGDGYIIDGDLYVWTADETWDNVGQIQGPDGTDGREIELQTSSTHIQWRYVGDASWIDLVTLSSLQGPQGVAGTDGTDGNDGREIELQTSATHVQWRYVGDLSWIDLILLSELQGPQGVPGVDGQEVELRVTSTHIQWRLGSGSWFNLVALEDLKGDGVPTGGTQGQILRKNSSTNFDTSWVTPPFLALHSPVFEYTTQFLISNNTLNSRPSGSIIFAKNADPTIAIGVTNQPTGWQATIVAEEADVCSLIGYNLSWPAAKIFHPDNPTGAAASYIINKPYGSARLVCFYNNAEVMNSPSEFFITGDVTVQLL